MNTQSSDNTARHHRNMIAALLSVIPGLGQIYKGHYWEGFGIMMVGAAIVIWFGILASLAYAAGMALGFLGITFESWIRVLLVPVLIGLLPPLLAWLWVVCEAFADEDLPINRQGA